LPNTNSTRKLREYPLAGFVGISSNEFFSVEEEGEYEEEVPQDEE